MLELHTELLRALQTHSVVFLAIDNSVIKLYNRVVPVEQENPIWVSREQVMYYLVNEYLIISSES